MWTIQEKQQLAEALKDVWDMIGDDVLESETEYTLLGKVARPAPELQRDEVFDICCDRLDLAELDINLLDHFRHLKSKSAREEIKMMAFPYQWYGR